MGAAAAKVRSPAPRGRAWRAASARRESALAPCSRSFAHPVIIGHVGVHTLKVALYVAPNRDPGARLEGDDIRGRSLYLALDLAVDRDPRLRVGFERGHAGEGAQAGDVPP